MPRRARSPRFQIRGDDGDGISFTKAESPGAVLSRALNIATNQSSPGVWEVWEWDDLLYRVHRLDSDKLDVRVEIVRG